MLGSEQGCFKLMKTFDYQLYLNYDMRCYDDRQFDQYFQNHLIKVMPDGHHVALGRHRSIYIINTANGKVLKTMPCFHRIQQVLVINDKSLLVGLCHVNDDIHCTNSWFDKVSLTTAAISGERSDVFEGLINDLIVLSDGITVIANIKGNYEKWDIRGVVPERLSVVFVPSEILPNALMLRGGSNKDQHLLINDHLLLNIFGGSLLIWNLQK